MASLAVVDTGPLYAVADRSERDHARCLVVLGRRDLNLVIPALVVAEAAYLIGSRLGATAEAAFLRGLAAFPVEAPTAQDWPRIADLVAHDANFPLGGTDASVIALAERLSTDIVITLDRRHFSAVKPRHCAAFQLLP